MRVCMDDETLYKIMEQNPGVLSALDDFLVRNGVYYGETVSVDADEVGVFKVTASTGETIKLKLETNEN